MKTKNLLIIIVLTLIISASVPVAKARPSFANLSGIIKITLGDSHTCALTSSGGVKCWGANTYILAGDEPTRPVIQSLLPKLWVGKPGGTPLLPKSIGPECAPLKVNAWKVT